ncbi:hypothetical protein BH09MYX1_BH09MYX1_42690 [soil metagenome]
MLLRRTAGAIGVWAFVAAFGCSSSDPGPTINACTPTPLRPIGEGFFADISAASGIQKNNFVPTPSTPIPINDHSRLAFADIDGDGYDDVVMHSLFPNPQKGVPFEHLVFLNDKDKTFRDFSDESGLRAVQSAFFVFGDVDNDGDQDCFAGLDIALPGETASLWLNDGKGHFTKKEGSGVESANYSANGVFADFNGDSFLDLYSGNGGTTTAVPDQLYFGNGDGTFTEASANLKGRPAQPTNGVVTCDYDDDGDQDILVAHYGVSIKLGWKALWENDGTGVFTNVARDRGFHALATGNYIQASTGNGRDAQPVDPGEIVGSNGFGIDCQDIDGDGHMDVWLAAISHPDESDDSRKWSDPSQLLLNKGGTGGFANAFLDRKLPFNEGDIDAAAVDFDNDGLIDLSVTRDKKYEPNYNDWDQLAWLGLMHQNVDGTFTSVGKLSGINDASEATDRVKAGQNLGWADIDHDGDLDLLVGGRDNGGGGRANYLFENLIGKENGWVGIRLHGDGQKINRDAIGARVTVTVNGKRFIREVKSSRGTYSSADGRAMIFGLGADGCSSGVSKVDISVRWPDGTVKVLKAGEVGLNAYLDVTY